MDFSAQDKNDVWLKQNQCCHYCRTKIPRVIKKNFDHKIPESLFPNYLKMPDGNVKKELFLRNGVRPEATKDNDRSNLHVLCMECNNKKKKMDYYNYIEDNIEFFELFGWSINKEGVIHPDYDDEKAEWNYQKWDEFREIPKDKFIEKHISEFKPKLKSENKIEPDNIPSLKTEESELSKSKDSSSQTKQKEFTNSDTSSSVDAKTFTKKNVSRKKEISEESFVELFFSAIGTLFKNNEAKKYVAFSMGIIFLILVVASSNFGLDPYLWSSIITLLLFFPIVVIVHKIID